MARRATGEMQMCQHSKRTIECNRDYLSMENGVYLTWNNKTDSVCASYCLYIPMDRKKAIMRF